MHGRLALLLAAGLLLAAPTTAARAAGGDSVGAESSDSSRWALLRRASVVTPPVTFAGLSLDITVVNVEYGIIVQVWRGRDVCDIPDNAVVVSSGRVLPGRITLELNLPAIGTAQGFYSVCAAYTNYSAYWSDRPPSSGGAAPPPARVYVAIGTVEVYRLVQRITARRVAERTVTFTFRVEDPSGSFLLPQLCADAAACDGLLSGDGGSASVSSGSPREADLAYLLQLLRVSLFYVNLMAGADYCLGLPLVLGDLDRVPQTNLTVAEFPQTSQFLVRAEVRVPAALLHPGSYMTCVGPIEAIVEPVDLYQGHTVAGAADFVSLPSGSSSSSSSSDARVGSHYPQSLVLGQAHTITSATRLQGYAALAAAADCLDLLDGPVPLVDGTSTLTAPRCTALPSAVYCEGETADPAGMTPVGRVELLMLFNCTTGARVNLVETSVPPAVPVTSYGLTEGFAWAPYVSRTRDCVRGGDRFSAAMAAHGYTPAEDEYLERFYVCVTSPDRTLLFTTTTPTLQVHRFDLVPQRVVVSEQPQYLALQPPATFPETSFFVAGLGQCEGASAAASAASENAAAEVDAEAWRAAAVAIAAGGGTLQLPRSAPTGLYSLCTARWAAGRALPALLPAAAAIAGDAVERVPVQSLLHVAPPTVTFGPTAFTGAVLCATAAVADGTYALAPGVDSVDDSYAPYRPYYRTFTRELFLAAVPPRDTAGACEAAPASPPTVVRADGRTVCFDTVPLAAEEDVRYTICAGTPNGPQAARSTTRLFEPSIEPATVRGNTTVWVHLANAPNTSFRLSAAATDGASTCQEAVGGLPGVLTNASSIAALRTTVTVASTGDEEPLPPGTYMLCRYEAALEVPEGDGAAAGSSRSPIPAAGPWVPHATLTVLRAVGELSLSADVMVAGVATAVAVTAAVDVSLLLPGLYDSPRCDSAFLGGPSQANWTTHDRADQIVVQAAAPSTSPVYLCQVVGPLAAPGSADTTAGAAAAAAVLADAFPALGLLFVEQPTRYPLGSVSTCRQFNIFFSHSEAWGMDSSLQLQSAPCSLPTSTVVQVGLPLARSYRAFLVNDTQLATPPRDVLAMCLTTRAYRPETVEPSHVFLGHVAIATGAPSRCLTHPGVFPLLTASGRADRLTATWGPWPATRWGALIALTVLFSLVSLALLVGIVGWRRVIMRAGAARHAVEDPPKQFSWSAETLSAKVSTMPTSSIGASYRTAWGSRFAASHLHMAPEDIAARVELSLVRRARRPSATDSATASTDAEEVVEVCTPWSEASQRASAARHTPHHSPFARSLSQPWPCGSFIQRVPTPRPREPSPAPSIPSMGLYHDDAPPRGNIPIPVPSVTTDLDSARCTEDHAPIDTDRCPHHTPSFP